MSNLKSLEVLNPLAHPICLLQPERITHSTWHEHIPFAMLLVELVRPKTIVELGTYYGDSYCAFCQAIVHLRLNARCYAIDTWEGDPQSGFYGAEVLDDLRRYHDPRYGGFSRLIRSSFDDALRHFEDGSIDLLHIDGHHAYASVKHDFESWRPKMSQTGIVLLHDINVRQDDFGVGRLWDELKAEYPSFELLHGHGLGVLAIGDSQLPQELHELFHQKDGIKIASARELFYRLGRVISQQSELTVVKGQLETRSAELQAKTADHERLQAELQAKTADHERLQADLSAIKASMGYRVMTFYASRIDRLAPDGTTRGKLRKRLVSLLQNAKEKKTD
jgi:hypothetical protein